MIKKILILILIFYFLALLEASFLIQFPILNWLPSLILILTILLNIFEKPRNRTGLFAAFFGGFFWDIFSSNFLGFHILILLGLAIFIKFIVKNYIHPVIRLRAR